MLILRLLLIVAAISIVLSGAMYLFTRNPKYLSLAWQIVKLVLFLLLLFGLLYLLERYVLIGWRILV